MKIKIANSDSKTLEQFFIQMLDQVGQSAEKVTSVEVTDDTVIVEANGDRFLLYVDLMSIERVGRPTLVKKEG